jgi:MFS transporter, ACS family, glucarate transporter
VVRFLFGAGEAGAFPNSASVIRRWIPQQERARASSVIWLATAVGGAITPLIVVAIEQKYSWRLAFPIFAAVGFLWTAIWYSWFRDSPWLKVGVSEAERELIGQPPTGNKAPVDWPRLLRNGNFQRLLLMYHTYCWGAYFYLSWLHTYLQVGRGFSENEMRLASALPSSAGILGVVAGGYLSDRLARRYSLRLARCSIGAVALIGAGVFMAGATLTSDNWWAVAFLTVSLGIMNAMLPVSWSLCVDIGQDHTGTISGAMNMAGQVGSLISSVVFGYLVEWFGSYDKALMPMAAMLIVSGLLFASIKPTSLFAEESLPRSPSFVGDAVR